MARVLHLIDCDAGFQNRAAAEQLARGTEVVGSQCVDSSVAGIVRGLKHVRRRSDFDLIHAFGPRALSVAAIAGAKTVYAPGESPSPRAARWLRAITDHRDVQVVCPADTTRRFFVERGVPIDRCHLIRPAVDFSKLKRRRNDILRATLGFLPGDHVMLAAGESTRAANHRLAVWAASILHVLNPRHRLLIWGKGAMSGQVIRFSERLRRSNFLCVATEKLSTSVSFEELLPAADTVLVTSDADGRPDTLPIAIAMAAGMPMVSTVSPTVAELLEDRHTALMTTKPQPRLIAQRVLDLLSDSRLAWSIADMARTEAYEYFSLTRLLDQHRTLYRQFSAHERVEIPQPQPGAGLRFHGRAS